MVCWTEKRSEEHLPSSNESKEKHKHTNDKEIGTGITKYTGQRKINERHSIERVWHSAGRELLVFFTLTDRASTIQYPVIHVVANPVRGLLDRKRSEEHLPSSNESKRKTQTHKTKRNCYSEGSLLVIDVKDLKFTACRLTYIYEGRCLKV